jgi:hypothetical protein
VSLVAPGYESSSLAGTDFSWIATDRDGHVAWLVTFGSAVVPSWVETTAAAYDFVESALDAPFGHGDEQWRRVARAGVFAYDWKVYEGPYTLIATPSSPVMVDDLAPALAALARRSCFAHACFRERATIDVGDVRACVHRP